MLTHSKPFQHLACDVIDWTWTQKPSANDNWKIFSAMNISVLMNGGNEETMNANPKDEFSSQFFALRDIKKGEGE